MKTNLMMLSGCLVLAACSGVARSGLQDTPTGNPPAAAANKDVSFPFGTLHNTSVDLLDCAVIEDRAATPLNPDLWALNGLASEDGLQHFRTINRKDVYLVRRPVSLARAREMFKADVPLSDNAEVTESTYVAGEHFSARYMWPYGSMKPLMPKKNGSADEWDYDVYHAALNDPAAYFSLSDDTTNLNVTIRVLQIKDGDKARQWSCANLHGTRYLYAKPGQTWQDVAKLDFGMTGVAPDQINCRRPETVKLGNADLIPVPLENGYPAFVPDDLQMGISTETSRGGDFTAASYQLMCNFFGR